MACVFSDILSSEFESSTAIQLDDSDIDQVSTHESGATTFLSASIQQSGLPQKIGPYEILQLLGRGGMGSVYQARDCRLNRFVALKMMTQAESATSSEIQRFRTEAEAIACLHHPNIVQIYSVEEFQATNENDHTTPLLILEYVPGQSLARTLDGTPWLVDHAVSLIEVLARAMQVAHRAGIVHRDLKPANILLPDFVSATFVEAKISDFGLAKIAHATLNQTQSGLFLGTPAYCSPEQAQGLNHEVGPAADIYALGAILYELLTGSPPLRGSTMVETLGLIVNKDPCSLQALNPEVPYDVEVICLKCLEKKPTHRYATAAELADDLRRWRSNQPIKARVTYWGPLIKWIQRKPTAAALTAVSVVTMMALVALAIGSYLFFGLQEQKTQLDQQKIELVNVNQELKEQRDLIRRYQYASEMMVSERAWLENDLYRMRKILNKQQKEIAIREDLRGFEWYHQWALANQAEFSIQTFGRIFDSGLSQDGRIFACTTDQHKLHCFDLEKLEEIYRMPGKKFRTTMALSRDGRIIAGASDGEIVGYDRTKEQKVFEFFDEMHQIDRIRFNVHADKVLSSGREGSLISWDLTKNNNKQLWRGVGSDCEILIATCPATNALAISTKDELVLWNARGKLIKQWKIYGGTVTTMAFDASGKHLATALTDGMIQLWNVETGLARSIPNHHSGVVSALAISPDNMTMATAGPGHKIILSNVESGHVVRTIQGHTQSVKRLHFSPNGDRLISCSDDTMIYQWDLTKKPNPQVVPFVRNIYSIERIAFSEAGYHMASLRNKQLVVWNLREQKKQWHTEIDDARCIHMSLSRNGQRVAVLKDNNDIELWEIGQENPSKRIKPNSNLARRISLSPDGKLLALGTATGNLELWDLDHSTMLFQVEGNNKHVVALAFDADGTQLACAVFPNQIHVWDVKRQTRKFTLPCEGGDIMSRLVFSPDGKLLAADQWNTAAVWSMSTGSLLWACEGHAEMIHSVCFSPDGKRLATAGSAGTISLWDSLTGQQTMTSRNHTENLLDIQFAADGSYLFGLGSEGGVFWHAATADTIRQAAKTRIRIYR